MVLNLRSSLVWACWASAGGGVAMAILVNWAMMSMFLIVVAWQIAMATTPFRALSLVVLSTLVVLVTLALVPNPDLCWVHWMSFGLQLSALFTASALRREAETARALARAQAVLASTVRTRSACGLARASRAGATAYLARVQLEIASHVGDPGRARIT